MVTNNSRVCDAARYLSNHGENFGQSAVGLNYRPNEVTACIAYHGLMELGENNRQRIKLAEALTGYIRAEPKLRKYIEIPESVKFDGSHVFYVYPFKLKNMSRHAFAKRMMTCHSLHVGEGYIQPTLQHYRAFKRYARGPLPAVEDLSKNTLCLFSHVVPGNTVKEMERTVAAMVNCVGR